MVSCCHTANFDNNNHIASLQVGRRDRNLNTHILPQTQNHGDFCDLLFLEPFFTSIKVSHLHVSEAQSPRPFLESFVDEGGDHTGTISRAVKSFVDEGGVHSCLKLLSVIMFGVARPADDLW